MDLVYMQHLLGNLTTARTLFNEQCAQQGEREAMCLLLEELQSQNDRHPIATLRNISGCY